MNLGLAWRRKRAYGSMFNLISRGNHCTSLSMKYASEIQFYLVYIAFSDANIRKQIKVTFRYDDRFDADREESSFYFSVSQLAICKTIAVLLSRNGWMITVALYRD